MIAAEILMPRTVFQAAFNQTVVDTAVVRRLASMFQTSLTATVLRCAEFRPISVMSVHEGRKKWGWARHEQPITSLGSF